MKLLRKKEVKELNEQIKQLFNLDDFFDKKGRVGIEDNIVIYNEEAVFFYHKKKLVPTLKLLLKNNFLPKVTVDMGAIKFVASGADVMRPGIVETETFEKDDFIVVIDQNHKKPLAVCVAKLSSIDINESKNGNMLKSIHYIGDNIYQI